MKEITLKNNTKIQLTLNLMSLYMLKNSKHPFYAKYNDIICKGMSDVFDQVIVIYTAYLCANINNLNNCISYDDFFKEIPDEQGIIGETFSSLLSSRKK